MVLQRRRFLYLAAGAAVLPALGGNARAQSYPAHPVRVIVPFSAGGPTDVFARIIAGNLSRNLGQQFYVENQPGAGGNLGMGAGARAAPDGYAITIVSTSYVVNPSSIQKFRMIRSRILRPLLWRLRPPTSCWCIRRFPQTTSRS
jgi:tripartite-type tricarboxylate transporter receptor subunit TctC